MTTRSSTEPDPDVIERLDAGEPPASPEEAQARAPYERLLERIRDLDEAAPLTGWEDRAVARWSASRRRRRIGLAAGVVAAVGLAAALLLLRSPPSAPGLEVAALTPSRSTRNGNPSVGDSLHVQALVDRPYTDLRVYLETTLVVRCPGGATCRRDASALELDWNLVEPGTYQIIMLSSVAAIPAPGDGGLDRDLLDARSAGVSIELRRLVVSR